MAAVWVSSLIFLATIAALLTDRINRTIAVLAGAAVMLAAGLAMGFYTPGQALAAVDFNTLGLLLGMMMLMAMFGKTGAIEALAILAAQKSRGTPLLPVVNGSPKDRSQADPVGRGTVSHFLGATVASRPFAAIRVAAP